MNDEAKKFVAKAFEQIETKLGSLTAKMGMAASEIWRFTVTAQMVRAEAELRKSVALGVLAVVFLGWSAHVATMKLPHDVRPQEQTWANCRYVSNNAGLYHIDCGQEPRSPIAMEDRGLSTVSLCWVISSLLALLVGTGSAIQAVYGAIDALRDLKMAEYYAYQDILDDLEQFW